MKRLLAFILCLLCILNVAYSESPATQTDLYEIIDDDDWGQIDIEFERRVYIDIDKDPVHIGDTITLTAILVDFHPEDIVTFQWEYTIDESDWIFIDDATEQTYTFTLDDININYLYHVIVTLEGIE